MFKFLKNIVNNPSITASEAQQKVKKENCILLDVREGFERKMNSIAGSLHIPVGQLKSRLNELELHKEKEIIVYCATGSRSTMATAVLNSNGFNSINLLGGIGAYK
jgi:rhodanese-related sulfurtransferase